MKAAEVREFPTEELQARLEELKEELFNLRFQNATGQLEQYKRLGVLRRDIARIETTLRQRELGLVVEPAPEERPARRARRLRKETEAAEAQDVEPSDEAEADVPQAQAEETATPQDEDFETEEEAEERND